MRRDVVSPIRTCIDHLRRRIISNHLRRSVSSTLRRTVAGLLLAEQLYRTARTARVVLVAEDEVRLTDRMHTPCGCLVRPPASGCRRPAVIEQWAPPLNLDHAGDRWVAEWAVRSP